MPDLQDRPLVCVDCGGTFIWTMGEQLFYADKGLTFPPKRCPACQAQKNLRLSSPTWSNAQPDSSAFPEVEVECADCGVLTTVPFHPTQGRPVYCRACFERHRATPNPKTATPGS